MDDIEIAEKHIDDRSECSNAQKGKRLESARAISKFGT